MFCCLCFVRKLQNRLHALRCAVKEIVIHKYPYDLIRLTAIKDRRILILLLTMSKFNIRMKLTDARDYTYLYSNSSAFTVIGGICALSDRMHAGIVLFQKRRNV